MELTIFAKKRTSKDGKVFFNFLTRIKNKRTGEEEVMAVRFRDPCPVPNAATCPMNIVVDKADCNIAIRSNNRKVVDKDTGEVTEKEGVTKTLWVTAWEHGAVYVDHSTDDYFD